jgi:hypothetical protein
MRSIGPVGAWPLPVLQLMSMLGEARRAVMPGFFLDLPCVESRAVEVGKSIDDRSNEELAKGLATGDFTPRKEAFAKEVLRRRHDRGWTVELRLSSLPRSPGSEAYLLSRLVLRKPMGPSCLA